MEIKINDSCRGRGCHVIFLPYDSRVNHVYSKMFRKRNDIQKILSKTNLFLDKMEKKEK
jgi:hypothetical protein